MSEPARQTLRVISIADAALKNMGVRDTRDHIMLITDSRRAFSVFAISTTPFTREQSEQVLAVTRARDFIPLALPHLQIDKPANVYEKMIGLEDKSAFIGSSRAIRSTSASRPTTSRCSSSTRAGGTRGSIQTGSWTGSTVT